MAPDCKAAHPHLKACVEEGYVLTQARHGSQARHTGDPRWVQGACRPQGCLQKQFAVSGCLQLTVLYTPAMLLMTSSGEGLSFRQVPQNMHMR